MLLDDSIALASVGLAASCSGCSLLILPGPMIFGSTLWDPLPTALAPLAWSSGRMVEPYCRGGGENPALRVFEEVWIIDLVHGSTNMFLQ